MAIVTKWINKRHKQTNTIQKHYSWWYNLWQLIRHTLRRYPSTRWQPWHWKMSHVAIVDEYWMTRNHKTFFMNMFEKYTRFAYSGCYASMRHTARRYLVPVHIHPVLCSSPRTVQCRTLAVWHSIGPVMSLAACHPAFAPRQAPATPRPWVHY